MTITAAIAAFAVGWVVGFITPGLVLGIRCKSGRRERDE